MMYLICKQADQGKTEKTCKSQSVARIAEHGSRVGHTIDQIFCVRNCYFVKKYYKNGMI